MAAYLCLFRMAAFLLLASLAGAQAHAATPGTPQICVARIVQGQNLEGVMAQSSAFDCVTPQTDLGKGDFLVALRHTPAPAIEGDPYVLRLASLWQDGLRVHYRFADGTRGTRSFTAQTASRFMAVGAIFEVPLPQSHSALEEVFVEVRGSANLRGIVVGPKLVTRSESVAITVRLVALYSAFAGLALALIVYNLSLWAAMRHRFQLWYCVMVGGLMAYTFTSSGLAELVFPALDNNDRLRLNFVLLAIVAASALQFVRHFFEPRVFGRRLRALIRWTTVAGLGSAVGFALLAPLWIAELDRAYFLSMSAMLGVIGPTLYNAWTRRSGYFWMFVLAWTAPVLTSLLRAFYGFGLIGYSFWLDNGNIIALSVEALLSSLMITVRLREMSRERDHALANEQVARRLAATDPLTGLLNRRSFLDLAIGRAGRQRLMLIDLDNFKSVNDRLGHEAGDQVLRAVADAIQHCRPAGSLAVRLGGEEFALLLSADVMAHCPPEMVLEAVRNHEMPRNTKVTVSIGFAEGSVTRDEDWKRLYRLADAALYRAKSDGRDRACRATDFRAVA